MSKAYYNELDPFAAQWLRNLMAAGLIPDGEVDERDIRDIRPNELTGYSQCHFFAGLGGWPLALRLAGWPDSTPCWTGSAPCQSFSQAGSRKGLADERHLWPAWFHLIRVCRPGVVFGEQVESAIGLGWLDVVQSDLEAEAYRFGCVGVPASSVMAPHGRPRIWFVADAIGYEQSRKESRMWQVGRMGRIKQPVPWNKTWQSALRQFRAMDDGLSYGVEATDAARNAIVPQAAQAFIEAYIEATR